MAEGKKGFILYADQKEIFDQLPDEKAGILIKHIYSYVNDKDPKTNDPIIKLAFTPIQQQLKRDLDKWEGIRLKRSDAGKASAKARKHKTSVKSVEQSSTNPTSVKSVEQSSTNPTVIVNDNVNENEIESVINEKLHPALIGFRKNVLEEAKTQGISIEIAMQFFKHWSAIDHNSGKFLFQATDPFGIQNRLKNWQAIENKKEEQKPKQKISDKDLWIR